MLTKLGIAGPTEKLTTDSASDTNSDPFGVVFKMYPQRVIAGMICFSAFFGIAIGLGAWLPNIMNEKGFSITVKYDAKSDAPVPDFAKKFMGETVSVTQTDAWDAATKTGKITTEIKGAPVKVTADMKLEASGKGAVNRMVWTLSCGIPLVGGKLESILAEDVKVKSKRDEAASQTLLEGY